MPEANKFQWHGNGEKRGKNVAGKGLQGDSTVGKSSSGKGDAAGGGNNAEMDEFEQMVSPDT